MNGFGINQFLIGVIDVHSDGLNTAIKILHYKKTDVPHIIIMTTEIMIIKIGTWRRWSVFEDIIWKDVFPDKGNGIQIFLRFFLALFEDFLYGDSFHVF